MSIGSCEPLYETTVYFHSLLFCLSSNFEASNITLFLSYLVPAPTLNPIKSTTNYSVAFCYPMVFGRSSDLDLGCLQIKNFKYSNLQALVIGSIFFYFLCKE